MKKWVFTISLLMFLAVPAFASSGYLNRCTPLSSNSQNQLSSSSNPAPSLLDKFIQNIMQNELKRYTGSNFEVSFRTFSLQDLVNGKFKSLSIKGNNISVEGVHITFVEAKTLCGFNHLNLASRPISFKHDMIISVKAEISAADLRNTFQNRVYSEMLRTADLKFLGLSSFVIYPSTIHIVGGKIYFTGRATPFAPYKPIDLSVSIAALAQNSMLISSRVDFINLYTGFSFAQFPKKFDASRPLVFPAGIPGYNMEVEIQSAKIVNDRVFAKGFIFIHQNS